MSQSNGSRRLEQHLWEQVYELAALTVEARETRVEEAQRRREACRLEEQARVLGRRTWLHTELADGPLTVRLPGGWLVTVEKQGSTSPPQHPRITISQFVQAEADSAEASSPEVVP